MIIDPSPQGSPEWHAARCGVLTASLYSTAIDKLQSNRDGRMKGEPSAASEALASTLAIERITGNAYRGLFDSAAMREGREQEPRAREWYEETRGVMVQESGLVLTDDRRFGYSTDGFVCHTKGAIEIKTLVSAQRIAQFVLTPELIVSDFLAQCDGGMWLCHLEWIDLIVWIPAFAVHGRCGNVLRIHRSEQRIERLVEGLVQFDQRVTEIESLYSSYSLEDIEKRVTAYLAQQERVTTVDFRETPWDSPEQNKPITKTTGKTKPAKTTPIKPGSTAVAAVLDNPFNFVRT